MSAPQRRVPSVPGNRNKMSDYRESVATMDESSCLSSSSPGRISSIIPENIMPFGLSSMDSSVALSEAEPSWTCPRCSYSNVDAKNERCALCGSNDTTHISESKQRKQQRHLERQRVHDNSLREFSWRSNNRLSSEDDQNDIIDQEEPAILSAMERGLKRPDSESRETMLLPKETTLLSINDFEHASRRPEADDDDDDAFQKGKKPSVQTTVRLILPTNSTEGPEDMDGLMLPKFLLRQDALLVSSAPSREESVATQQSEISDSTVRTSNRTELSRPPLPSRPTQPSVSSIRSAPVLYPSRHPAGRGKMDSGDDAPPTRSRTMPPSRCHSSGTIQQQTVEQHQCNPGHAPSLHHFYFNLDKEQPTSTRSINSVPVAGRQHRHFVDEAGASPVPTSSRSLSTAISQPSTLPSFSIPSLGEASVPPSQVSDSRTPPSQFTNSCSPETDYPLVHAVEATSSCSQLPQDRTSNDDSDSRIHSAKFPYCSGLRFLPMLIAFVVVGAVTILIVLLVHGKSDSAQSTIPSSALIQNAAASNTTSVPPNSSHVEWKLALPVRGGPMDHLGSSVALGGPVGNWVAMTGYDFVQVAEYTSSGMVPLGASIPFGNESGRAPPLVSLSAERRRMAVTTSDGRLLVYQRDIRSTNGDWKQVFAFNTTVPPTQSAFPPDQKDDPLVSCGDISGSGLIVASVGLTRTMTGAFAAIQVWDLESSDTVSQTQRTYLEVVANPTSSVLDVALSYDGGVLAVLANETVTLFRREDEPTRWADETPVRDIGNGSAVLSMALSGDGLTLAASTVEGITSIYAYGSMYASSPSKHQWAPSNTINAAGAELAISYDGNVILTGNRKNETDVEVTVWHREIGLSNQAGYEYSKIADLVMSTRPSGFTPSVALPKNRQWDLMLVGDVAQGDLENGQVLVFQEISNAP